MLLVVLSMLVGASFLGAGIVAWRNRPRNRVGPLMVAIGLAWLSERFVDLEQPLGMVALAVAGLWAAALAHLVLAFPTGRLDSVAARVVAGAAYAYAAGLGISDAIERGYGTIPPLARFFYASETAAILVLGVAVLWLAVARWRRTGPTRRRVSTPVLAAATPAIALFVVSKPLDDAGVYGVYLGALGLITLAAIPLAYLASLLRQRIDRAGVADLIVRLSGTTSPVNLRDALAATLHDPGLRVGYWVAEQERYVDTDGRPVPTAAPGQVVTRVDRGGNRVAVLLHDPALLDEPELVEAACAAAGLALENERLTADLRARVRQLAASRSRVLQATETERRRIERDLHDGVQQRLLSVAMTLGLAQRSAGPAELIGEAKESVLAALDDLRALCNGIHPPVLTERGLAGAVRELTATAPVSIALSVDPAVEPAGSLPPEVESTAYYLVAEAVTNITKHAGAGTASVGLVRRNGSLVVEVRDDGRGGADPALGSGLAGMADRVEASGGRLALSSPPGGGTTVRAELPCGS